MAQRPPADFEAGKRGESELNNPVIVATNHKTGTVWMKEVFTAIAEHLCVPFGLFDEKAEPDILDQAPQILFCNSAGRGLCSWMAKHPWWRVMHIIRDPRDVIISAMHYHCTATESWLHQTRADLGGLTYQQKLKSLPDDHRRYLFEMNRKSRRTIQSIRKWNYALPNSVECKYEELIEDIQGVAFRRCAAELGFAGKELLTCEEIFREKSLFSKTSVQEKAHVRSGRTRQWEKVFDAYLAREFMNRFGNILAELNYESDNSWVSRLGEHAASAE